MRRKIPGFSALLAFEAAGRLQSFTLAANELLVTQSAISRQIRDLEKKVGKTLFRRLTRKVELTEAGRKYLSEVQFAIGHLERATLRLKFQKDHAILNLSVLPSAASFWLMPRLGDFSKRHPEIETRIITSIRPVDLQSREADVAIRVGAKPGKIYSQRQPRIDLEMVTSWKGVIADYLFPDVLVAVYSSRLIKARKPITSLDALLKYPLIHTSSRIHAWPDWLRAQGVRRFSEPMDIQYGHFFMSLEAARQGEGVAIVPNVLLVGTEWSDLTIADFPAVHSAGEYYLLSLAECSMDLPIAAFRNWVTTEISRQSIPGS